MTSKTANRKALLEKVREKLKEQKGGFQRDPDEWRPPRVAEGKTYKAKGFILPPLSKGDKCASGKCQHDMDVLPFIPVGDHWVNRKKYPCPRVYDGDECQMCDFGFELFGDTEDKETRKKISRTWLPRTYHAVNIYFPPLKSNPDDLQGKVMYAALPKTIFDKLDACLNRDDAGDDEDDPQPWGIFWNPEEAYPLSIQITHKGGYNDYTSTKLIPRPQAIAETDKKIQEILDKRHDLVSKYPERTAENRQKLKSMIEQLVNGEDSENSDDSNSNSSDGFDDDESSESSESKEVETKTEDLEDSKPKSTESDDDDDDEEELKNLLSKIESGDDD